MFFVYILRSLRDGKYYIGYTKNLEQRIQEHNREKSPSVKNRAPFELAYKERYEERREAAKREREIKSYKGGEAFKKLIKSAISDPIV